MPPLRPRRKLSLKSPGPADPPPPEVNPELNAALLASVEKQIISGSPPETRATVERLVAAGYTPEGARQMIATTVAREVFSVMASGQAYDHERYVAALARLPEMDP